ncbi:hypothetical protein PVAP13_8NG220401 [Panicum virgatum]|uniref:Uncharacterized protein n=1 Tax=Panicum virgatum TaxID=38727 RepID=A0A8T0P5N3_PANVG|nr:hypothetical protein PVAP13_8NG220401 [Panicum virgatum]
MAKVVRRVVAHAREGRGASGGWWRRQWKSERARWRGVQGTQRLRWSVSCVRIMPPGCARKRLPAVCGVGSRGGGMMMRRRRRVTVAVAALGRRLMGWERNSCALGSSALFGACLPRLLLALLLIA